MKYTGWEFELGHANTIGKVRYDVNFNISFFKNEVTSILSPTIGTNLVKEGLPYNSWYMVEWIGNFQNQAEIDAAPKHQYNPKPGDLKFKDQLTIDSNNDGVMDKADGIIDSKDRVVVDGFYPKFYYGGVSTTAEVYIPTLVDQGGVKRVFDKTKHYLMPFPQNEIHLFD